jgi:hypothetical protein
VSIIQILPKCNVSIIQILPKCNVSISQVFPKCNVSISQVFPKCNVSISQVFPKFNVSIIQIFPFRHSLSVCRIFAPSFTQPVERQQNCVAVKGITLKEIQHIFLLLLQIRSSRPSLGTLWPHRSVFCVFSLSRTFESPAVGCLKVYIPDMESLNALGQTTD